MNSNTIINYLPTVAILLAGTAVTINTYQQDNSDGTWIFPFFFFFFAYIAYALVPDHLILSYLIAVPSFFGLYQIITGPSNST